MSQKISKIKTLYNLFEKTGKTCLIKCYITNNDIEQNKTITIIENYNCIVKVNDELVNMCICDTAGQEGNTLINNFGK